MCLIEHKAPMEPDFSASTTSVQPESPLPPILVSKTPRVYEMSAPQKTRIETWNPVMKEQKTLFDDLKKDPKYAADTFTYPYLFNIGHINYSKLAMMYALERSEILKIIEIQERGGHKVSDLISNKICKNVWQQPTLFKILDKDKFLSEFKEFFETSHSKKAKEEDRPMTKEEWGKHMKCISQRWTTCLQFKIMGISIPLSYAYPTRKEKLFIPQSDLIYNGVMFVKPSDDVYVKYQKRQESESSAESAAESQQCIKRTKIDDSCKFVNSIEIQNSGLGSRHFVSMVSLCLRHIYLCFKYFLFTFDLNTD